MEATDKKREIIEADLSTNNEQLINEVYELLHPQEGIVDLDLNELSADLQNKINRGLEDYHSGRYISHEQMKQKMQQWLLK